MYALFENLESGATVQEFLEWYPDVEEWHQQNLAGRRLGIVVLMATAWPRVQHRIEEIRTAIDEIQAGEIREVSIPRRAPDG